MFYFQGERFIISCDNVSCNFSTANKNKQGVYVELEIKGKLILTNYKLEFLPNESELMNLRNCYLSVKMGLDETLYWDENAIPLTLIYGIYSCKIHAVMRH